MDTAISAIGAASGIRTADISPQLGPAGPAKAPEASADREPEKRTSETADAVRELGRKIQEQLNITNISIAFTPYGAKNEKVAIKVMDRETGKVIREIPPEEIQNLSAKLGQLAGIIFNKTV